MSVADRAGATAALPLAAAIDALLGEPPAVVHPVVWMGKAIGVAEGALQRGSPLVQLFGGALLAGGGAAICYAGGVAIDRLTAGRVWLLPLRALVLKCCLAWRALDLAAARVEVSLGVGDLAGARDGLRWLVSRETVGLSAEQVAAAAVESVAENFSDSLIGPALAYSAGGLGGALAYRWLNTADAMIGYRGRYEWIGKTAARLDDFANLVPARLAALLLIAAGPDRRAGLMALGRDRGQTASPNAGWPMAAMAGLLGRALEKPGHYRLNAGAPAPDAADIAAARRTARLAWLILLAAFLLAHLAWRR
ncbi:MAG: adenosylcobinamide-phosphate synthase CbiB [Dehalococcoidia bacterium]